MDEVLIRLDPGNVEVITDSKASTESTIYGMNGGTESQSIEKFEYRLEAFRLGFHIHETAVFYKRGELNVSPVTLTEDTIRIQPNQLSIDLPYPDRTVHWCDLRG